MVSRLDVIHKVKLNYEVPYISGKGEVIDSLTVPINEERQGVGISYALINCNEKHLDSIFPSDGIDSLARMTKQVFQDLGVRPARIILQLWEYTAPSKPYSVEGRAPVNKERDTVLMIFTKPPFLYKFGHELVLWHQAVHAKDRWEHRFPAAHPMVNVGEWLDVLWHFSIDGRLEKWAKPHYSKAERLEEASGVLQGLRPQESPPALVTRLCGELWGRETTLAHLLEMGRDLGLEPASGI